MTILLVLLVLLPWSVWRQSHAHEITGESLIKLPTIFAIIGIAGLGTRDIPSDGTALGYLAFSVLLAVAFGVWRGEKTTVWREAGTFMSQGNRTTITLWVVMIVIKIGLGTVASITDAFPAEHAGEIFLFLALSFAVQNVVVAGRSLWRTPSRVGAVTH